MKDCAQCGGYGSMPSFDEYEVARGIEDTCYHCMGGGKCECELCRGVAYQEVQSLLPHSLGCSTQRGGDCTCGIGHEEYDLEEHEIRKRRRMADLQESLYEDE